MTPDDTTPSVPADELPLLVIRIDGDRRPADVVITPREAVLFLTMSATAYATTPCDDLHCEVCYEYVSSWMSIYQALDANDRLAVEDLLELYDVRAPAFPKGLR